MAGTDAAPSLEAALDELYGVEPDEFVATRKRLAAYLRRAEAKDAAKLVLAARRPTTAAWALNQLSRRQPELVESLLVLSRELESAQTRARAGDRDAMREATRAQRGALAAATDGALEPLGERANDSYRAQILATLHAASADETVGAQLRNGRLIREVSGSTGFPDGPNLTLVPELREEARAKPRVKTTDEARAEPKEPAKRSKRAPVETKGESAANEAAVRNEQRRLERERAALEQAQRRLDEAEDAARVAQDEATAAETAAATAREQIARLQADLETARRDARSADDAAARARREATRLARAATKLRSKR